MMSVEARDAARIELPEILDLGAAGPLAAEFLSHRGEALCVDASRVERMGGQCLQVLLSAANTWKVEAPAASQSLLLGTGTLTLNDGGLLVSGRGRVPAATRLKIFFPDADHIGGIWAIAKAWPV